MKQNARDVVTRRGFLRTAALAPAGAALGAAQSRPARKPNFVIFFTDDQRFNTVGVLNNPEVRTPHMDRLVREGTAFTHACIMGGTIGAVCAPSRAMLLSGQTLFHAHDNLVGRSGQTGRSRKPYVLFPEVLKNHGYATFGTGKWHNGEQAYARCFTGGGSIFFGGMSDHLQAPVADFDPSGQYPKEKRYLGKKFSSELFSDAAIGFLQQHKPDQPFCLYVSYTSPHDPRMAPKQYTDLYPPEKITLPENFLPEHPFDNGEMKIRDEELAPWPRTPEVVREHIAGYYAMITEVDAQIGRVLKALEETGHAGNTVIVFAADNGLAVGQHGLLGKQNLYDHSVRVPLVIGGPGLPKGRKNASLCYLLDIAPTLLDLAGIPVPGEIEGKSLQPLLRNPKATLRDSVFLAYREIQRGIRTDDWKLILYNVAGKQTVQLFHLKDDPWETRNLASEARQAGRVRELRSRLKDWMRQVGDPLDLDLPDWGRKG